MNRKKQALLEDHLKTLLLYKPFIFNSTIGTYLFVKKEESFEKLQPILVDFFNRSNMEHIKIYDTTIQPDYFRKVIQHILSSKEISALEWKHFISSFIMQIDPYNAAASPDAISVFENFRSCIDETGTKLQQKYLKRKLKMLRERVSLEEIEGLLKNDKSNNL